MSEDLYGIILCVIVMIWLVVAASESSSTAKFVFGLIALAAMTATVRSCSTSPTVVNDKALRAAAEEEQERILKTPSLVSTGPQGCEVYRFHDTGHWHYFTCCPNSQVTTDTAITTPATKSKPAVTHTESITTGGAP